MDDQAENEVVKPVGSSCVKRGERQDDEIHHVLHRRAEEQAADQWVIDWEEEAAAPGVIDRRDAECDEKMQQDSQRIGARASVERRPSKQPRGDRERNPPAEQNHRLREVQHADKKTTDADGQKSSAICRCHATKMDRGAPQVLTAV